jgi:type I restriction enzyme S subunit
VSGADLIGPLPPHWSVKPLRLIGRLLKGAGGSKEDAVDDGVPCVRYGELYTTHRSFIERARTCVTHERASDYTPIEFGDVLFAASGETIEEIGKSAVNLLHGARCGGDVVILRPTEAFVPRFLGYATDAAPVAAQKSLAGRGSTVKHIYPDALREVVIAVPPVDEQQAIADFLDRETGRLDSLVTSKQCLIELFAEKRKAIIATAVTRGLDPKVKLRDSGVAWLGAIPAHWAAMRVRHLISSLEQGWSPEAENREPTLDEWGVLKLNAVSQGVFDQTAAKTLLARMEPRPDIEVHAGDVLITRANTPSLVGDACFVTDTRPKLMLCDLIYRLRVEPERVDARFLVNFLTTAGRLHPEMTARGTSNSMVKLSQEHIKDWWTPVPPLDEQHAIVEHIARETAKLDAVRAATERTIALLKERRSALIAAAVTGQLDIGPSHPPH